MSNNLRILLIVLAVLLILLILRLISKNKLPVKYSLFWLCACLIIFLVGAFPNFISIFTSLIGFQTTSNLVTGIIIGLLLIITLLLTIIISDLKRRITLLMQEVSILKSDLNNKSVKK